MTGHIRKRGTQSGSSWQIVLDHGIDSCGKRKRSYITVKGNKKEAQAILNEKLAEYNKGTYISPSSKTVKDCIEEWVAVYVEPSLAPNTVRGYKVNFNNHTIPYIGHIPVQQLTPVQVQGLYSQLEKKGLSARSIRYVHTTLREALQYAYQAQYIAKNVADLVSPPKQGKHKTSVYTEKMVIEMLRCAEDTEMEIPLVIAVELGLRRGELLALKWSDIDWEKRTIEIQRNLVCIDKEYIFGDTKTKSGQRSLLLSEPLLKRLDKHRRDQNKIRLLLGSGYQNQDLIYCKKDGSPYHAGTLSHKFKTFLEKNKLSRIRFHDLRHTNATLLLQYGVPAKIASQRLGHANIAITLDTYSHVSTEMQEDAVSKLASGVLGRLDEHVR